MATMKIGLMRKPTPLTEAQALVILETQENGGLDADLTDQES